MIGAMRVLLITIGSYGDVLPFVALGKGLVARGHEATVVTNGYFRGLVESAGLGCIGLGDENLYERVRDHPEMWHPMRGFRVVFQQAVAPVVRQMIDIIRAWYQPGESVIVGSSLALGMRIAEDKWGYPCATVHLQPSCLRSCIAPPTMNGLFMPGWMPLSWKRRIWETGDRWFVDPVVCPAVNPIREELGLPPVCNALDRWWHAPKLTIGMFPEWYAPPPPDWPGQVRCVGFPLYDTRGDAALPAKVESFLQAGDKPIAFTPGSAMAHGHGFFRTAVAACERLGRRGLLLTLHPEQIPPNLPPTVLHVDYAPFSTLLPRCSTLVHHGGIGTTSQALRAGVPQLIMPLSHDQPDNAARIRRLGVGEAIYPKRFTPRRVARVLGALLASRAVAHRCRELAARFDGSDAITAACTLLESLHSKHSEKMEPRIRRLSPQMNTDEHR
jgi:rhamnosyltransferase subunit B